VECATIIVIAYKLGLGVDGSRDHNDNAGTRDGKSIDNDHDGDINAYGGDERGGFVGGRRWGLRRLIRRVRWGLLQPSGFGLMLLLAELIIGNFTLISAGTFRVVVLLLLRAYCGDTPA
jgi:hypothetical protein